MAAPDVFDSYCENFLPFVRPANDGGTIRTQSRKLGYTAEKCLNLLRLSDDWVGTSSVSRSSRPTVSYVRSMTHLVTTSRRNCRFGDGFRFYWNALKMAVRSAVRYQILGEGCLIMADNEVCSTNARSHSWMDTAHVRYDLYIHASQISLCKSEILFYFVDKFRLYGFILSFFFISSRL